MPKVLVLRTSNADGTSYCGFKWPEKGRVEAPDFRPTSECGCGLHGLLWGEGKSDYLNWGEDALWQVVEVECEQIIDLGDKVKFPRGEVVYSGDRYSATQYILQNGGRGRHIHGVTATAGNYGTATAGNHGTATAGNHGTATAGNYGIATAGDGGIATAGNYGIAAAGYRGTATAGGGGIAAAGNYGMATAGNYGIARAGYRGIAAAGYRGTATAGNYGSISIRWFDILTSKYQVAVAEAGVGGILPDVKYKLTDGGLFVKVEPCSQLNPQ